MEVFYASRFFLSFGCHSLLEGKRQQKMKQGDIGKWQEDTENVFYVPLPFSNVLLPHFLPSLAVKKAVKKMGIKFIYYHNSFHKKDLFQTKKIRVEIETVYNLCLKNNPASFRVKTPCLT